MADEPVLTDEEVDMIAAMFKAYVGWLAGVKSNSNTLDAFRAGYIGGMREALRLVRDGLPDAV